MAYRIIWTKNAGEDLKEIVSYLKKDWSSEVLQNFINELYSKLDVISNYPHAGKASLKEKSIRKIVITKHNVLYYKFEDDVIILLDFFDTRSEPDKDKLA